MINVETMKLILDTFLEIKTENYFTVVRKTGVWARGWGLQPPESGKPTIFRANAKFSRKSQQPKMKQIIVFIKRKKRNSFRLARWSARNPGFLLILGGVSRAK